MQISTSLQNTFTPTPTAAVSKSTQSSTVQPDTTTQTTDTINKDAYNYFNLGQDISPYTNIDPVQEQTNKDVVNYLTKIMDETTADGKKNLVAFDTKRYGAFFSDEDIQEINARLFSGSGSKQTGSFIVNLNPADLIKNAKPLPITHVADGYTHITLEESNKREIEKFKNLYSFSDEFSKTEKFQELYDKYKVLADKQRKTLIPLDDNFFVVLHTNDMKGYLTSEVVNKGFSKSEFIEHFSNISKDLKEIFSDHAGTISASSTQAIKESIKLYDKITADLKDMWGYGDLNVRA
jgi:hypothetical protein